MMLFVIPVLAVVRTTVDSEGTAAITEHSEKDELGTLVRHTEAVQAETADPWDKWTTKPYWTHDKWVTDQGWATIDGAHPLVGIRYKGLGTALGKGYPPGMKGTALPSQEFLYEFTCGAQTWKIAWKTSWGKSNDAGDPNGPAYAKHLAGTDSAGKGLHVLHESQGHQARPASQHNMHSRRKLFPKEYTAFPSRENVFNCPSLNFKIDQNVVEFNGLESIDNLFSIGQGVATNVQTQSGSQVLVLGFEQNCKKWTGGSTLLRKGTVETAPNCFAGQRAALLLHINVNNNPSKEMGSSEFPLEADRVVMYLQQN